MTRNNTAEARAGLDLERDAAPQREAAQAVGPGGSVAPVKTFAIGWTMLKSHWVQGLWTLIFVVFMGIWGAFGTEDDGPMFFIFAFFFGAVLGSLNFVFLPKGDHLRAFSLSAGQIRRLVTGTWGITLPASALLLVATLLLAARNGALLGTPRLLVTCLVGYLLILAFSVYTGWGEAVKIKNSAVGVDDVTIRVERGLERKNRKAAGGEGAEPEGPKLEDEERAIFSASTALDAAVVQPMRALAKNLAKWECGAALVIGLALAFIPWVGDHLGSYLGIAMIGALIAGRWVLTAYALPKAFLRWVAFSGDRKSWRRVTLRETFRATWSVVASLMLLGYPSLLNGNSVLAQKFSTTEILLGAPMLGLILVFQIVGTVLLTALATLRWPKPGALAVGMFFVYAVSMMTVLSFQVFFYNDAVQLGKAGIYVAITAVFALIATWIFYALIPKQDVRNAGYIMKLGQ